MKRRRVCRHTVTGTKDSGEATSAAPTPVFHYLSYSNPPPPPNNHAGQLAVCSGVTFLALEDAHERTGLYLLLFLNESRA